jgi:Helix-turn-helix domain
VRDNTTSRRDGRLYAAILEAGFSITGFARRMQCDRSTVWRIDRGLQAPPREWYQRAAALLGVSVDDIVVGEEVAA